MSGFRPAIRSARNRPEPQAMVQPSVAVAGVDIEVADGRRADQRRAVGRHRAQGRSRRSPAPGRSLAGTRSRTECSSVARRGWRKRRLKPASSAVPPMPHAVAQAGDRDLVGLVHHRRDGRHRWIGDRGGERIALHRIDRHVDAERAQQGRREASRRPPHRRPRAKSRRGRARRRRCPARRDPRR